MNEAIRRRKRQPTADAMREQLALSATAQINWKELAMRDEPDDDHGPDAAWTLGKVSLVAVLAVGVALGLFLGALLGVWKP